MAVNLYQSAKRKTTVVSIFPADKGLNSSLPLVFQPADALSISNNLIHTTSASRRTRPGIEPYHVSGMGSGSNVKLIKDFWRTSGSTQNQQVVTIADGRIYADNANGVFTQIGSINSSSNYIGVSADTLVGFTIIGVEGQAPLGYIQSGSTFELEGFPPNGWIVRKHKSSFYIAGDSSTPHSVYKSDTEDPEDWLTGTSDQINIDLGASDPYGITALFPDIFGDLYVAKWGSIYRLTTSTSPIAVVPVINTIGCLGHNAAAAVQNDIIFPSYRGLHSLSTTLNYGDVETSFLSFPVHDIWQNRIDFSRGKEISGVFIPEYNSYLMTFPRRGGDIWDLLGYNTITKDFFYWEDFGATFLSTFIDAYKRTRLIIGTENANVGLLSPLEDETFTDFLVAFSSSFTTPRIFPGQLPGNTWGFKNLTVFFKPTSDTINVTAQVDDQNLKTYEINSVITGGELGEFLLGVDTLGGASDLSKVSLPLNGYGSSIRIGFNCTPTLPTEGKSMEIFGYNIECESTEDTMEQVTL
jgi:hypothetical protein